jgi:hypothetical protein
MALFFSAALLRAQQAQIVNCNEDLERWKRDPNMQEYLRTHDCHCPCEHCEAKCTEKSSSSSSSSGGYVPAGKGLSTEQQLELGAAQGLINFIFSDDSTSKARQAEKERQEALEHARQEKAKQEALEKRRQAELAEQQRFNASKQDALRELKGMGANDELKLKTVDDDSLKPKNAKRSKPASPYSCSDCEHWFVDNIQKGLDSSVNEMGWIQGACGSYFNCAQKISGKCQGENGWDFYNELRRCSTVEQVQTVLDNERARLAASGR